MSDTRERLERLEEKMDKGLGILGELQTQVAKNVVILDEHMRRTKQLEGRMSVNEKMVWMGAGAVTFVGVLKAFGVF
jgi:uncharacterized coiled-coil protein SlyX